MNEHFLSGDYTSHFIEQFISEQNTKYLSSFVDDRVFLISAAIMAYKKYKKQSLIKAGNRWKQTARLENQRF